MIGRGEEEKEYCIYCGVDADKPHDKRCIVVEGELFKGALGQKIKQNDPEFNANLSRMAIVMSFQKDGLSSGEKNRDDRLVYETALFNANRNALNISVLCSMIEQLRIKLNHPIKKYFTRGLENEITQIIENILKTCEHTTKWVECYNLPKKKTDEIANNFEENKRQLKKALSYLPHH